MARLLPIAVIGVALVLAVVWYEGAFDTPEAPEPAAPPVADSPSPPASPPASAEAPETPAPATATATPLDKPEIDVVRIDREGEAVIVGKAAPGAEISISTPEGTIAVAKADERGNWVALSDGPLAEGDHEVTVEARSAGGEAAIADRLVVVSVPKRGSGEKPLVVTVPREGFGASEVVQRPEAPAAERTAAAEPKAEATAPATAPAQQAAAPAAADEKAEQAAAAAPQAEAEGDAPAAGVSVDAVDYDDRGNLALSGRAAPGSVVEPKLQAAEKDTVALGKAEADEQGRWQIRAEQAIAPGRYALTVDERDAAGAPRSRISLPFERAKPIADFPGERVLVVQPGNSLWRIARRVYGQGVHYSVIYAANRSQIGDPHLIFPGQIISVPQTH